MNYKNFLLDLWASKLYDSIRTNTGEVYAKSWYYKQYNVGVKKILDPNEHPNNALRKLWSKKICSYCDKILIHISPSQGDHIVAEFYDRGILWTVPCCKQCNSSKGKKDLIDWWVNHKGYDFSNLNKDVSGIFCRVKYRHMKYIDSIFDDIPDVYYTALQQVKDNWSLEFIE